MMQAVRGIYRGGVVELLEKPAIAGEAEVVVTFLTAGGPLETDEGLEELAVELKADAPPLDDFEPIVPAQPVLFSDIVLEDRR
jgi:hypothetical protein